MSDYQGILYVIATPIGNLDDLSIRAINTLKQVDIILAEDTRHSRKLLNHYDISPSLLLSYHDYNEQKRSLAMLDLLKRGKTIALISDAGTPLICDPGFHLVHLAKQQGILVSPIPGACATIAALSASGLPCHDYYFAGFLPAKKGVRQQRLSLLKSIHTTVIFYESPHRILATIADMADIFGDHCQGVIARELTKKFETIYCDTIANINDWLNNNLKQRLGEFVILIANHQDDEDRKQIETKQLLTLLLDELPLKQAVKLASKITGKKKNSLYQLALSYTQNR